MANAEFWKRLKEEFLEHAADDSTLTAHWRARFGRWELKEGPLPSHKAHPRAEKRFKKTAAEGAMELPELPPSDGTEPWQRMYVTLNTEKWEVWLNWMRKAEYNCHAWGGQIAVSKREWGRIAESGKSLVAVRTEFSRNDAEEWQKLPSEIRRELQRETPLSRLLRRRGHQAGKPRAGIRRELGLSIDDGGVEPMDWLQDAEINHLFQECARMCADLASGVERPSAEDVENDSARAGETAPAGLESKQEANLEPQRRKRGRPTVIPDDRKRRALEAKGGKARAQILYNVKYPTPQQIKNVPSILRHFERTQPKSE